MEIEYKGGNCVSITYKKYEFVSDPKISLIGLKDQGKNAAVQLVTQSQFEAPQVSENTVVVNGPGEYEVHNCSVKGIAANTHLQPEGAKTATIYRLSIDDVSVAIVGHIAANLSDDQIEEIGMVDILVLPVGGYGFTLEPKQAVDIIKSIEPKIVIPVHYAEDGVTYEVQQSSLEDFLKELGIQPQDPVTKLKLKSGQLPDKLTVCRLVRTK